MKKKFLLAIVIIAISLITVGSISVLAATTVNVESVLRLQSEHPYSKNVDTTWVYTYPAPADSLEITFSFDTETENNCDWIYVLDGNGKQIEKQSGTALANKTITVPGNVVKIRLTSDGSTQKNGFLVSNIKANGSKSVVTLASGDCGTNVTWELDSNGTLTIRGNGAMRNYYYAPWRWINEMIKNVVIENGVTTIGDEAFYYCTNLTSVTLPDSITTIGEKAFNNCKSLASISIPDSTTTIGDFAFCNCESITKITVPSSVNIIGEHAFQGCEKLTNIVIQEGVTIISDYAFSGCEGITSISIPKGVTTIGNYAFFGCYYLNNIYIPNSVTTIGKSVFGNCHALKIINYNGTREDWNKVLIDTDNPHLTSATKKYFWYVTLFDKEDNEICKKTQAIGSYVDTRSVVVPEGYNLVLYKDKELTEVYDINTPIAENLTLYVDFIKLNSLEFEGVTTANIGERGITQKVSFATDKESKYFSCTLKVPNSITVQEIKSDIFEIEQDYEIIDNDTHYYLFLIYNGDRNIPTYQTLNAFEIVLDVSENAVADEVLSIEILDDAILADDNGNSYEFVNIGKAEIKVNPIFAEEITIVGADEIDAPTQYTVSVLPENTTNQNVEWSVSDETIATISVDGLLIPVKKGIVTIKATAKDGSGVYAEKTVSVKVLGTVNSIATNIGTWDKEYTPNTTNYTIYVPKSTTSIRLTAKHDGTFKTDKTTFVNNVTRPVTLSTTSDETVLDLSYTCDGYDDNKYTITIIKFEGTKTEVSEDKKSFTITPINIENGKTVILALYNGEQFVEMQSAVYTGEAVPFTTTKAYTKAKVMVWEDFKTLKPVCEVENIQ